MSNKKPKVDKKLLNKWLKALESGKFKQGRNYLCKELEDGSKEYCCMGVLCEISGKSGWIKSDFGRYSFKDDFEYAPSTLTKRVGLSGNDTRLADMNDFYSLSFKQIADRIRAKTINDDIPLPPSFLTGRLN